MKDQLMMPLRRHIEVFDVGFGVDSGESFGY